MRVVFTIVCLVWSLKAYTQKAFEFEHYYGKTKDFEIRLSLANGYILGSEIIKTYLKTNKKVKYIVSAAPAGKSQGITFFPDPGDKATVIRKREFITLYHISDEYDVLPDKINAVCGIDLKTNRLKLYKAKAKD